LSDAGPDKDQIGPDAVIYIKAHYVSGIKSDQEAQDPDTANAGDN